jgi:uncharacterized membrane protein
MGDYERSTTVGMPVDDLFEYLSRVENLPRYMSRMTSARPVTGDEVEVEARIDPSADPSTSSGERTVTGEAWFHVDADGRRLEWGAEGPHDYRGELSVSPDGDGSTVVVRLHTMHDDAEAIEHGMDETLANIEQLAARS